MCPHVHPSAVKTEWVPVKQPKQAAVLDPAVELIDDEGPLVVISIEVERSIFAGLLENVSGGGRSANAAVLSSVMRAGVFQSPSCFPSSRGAPIDANVHGSPVVGPNHNLPQCVQAPVVADEHHWQLVRDSCQSSSSDDEFCSSSQIRAASLAGWLADASANSHSAIIFGAILRVFGVSPARGLDVGTRTNGRRNGGPPFWRHKSDEALDVKSMFIASSFVLPYEILCSGVTGKDGEVDLLFGDPVASIEECAIAAVVGEAPGAEGPAGIAARPITAVVRRRARQVAFATTGASVARVAVRAALKRSLSKRSSAPRQSSGPAPDSSPARSRGSVEPTHGTSSPQARPAPWRPTL